MGLLHSSLSRLTPFLPRPVLWRVARRYIAGVSLEELLAKVEAHERKGWLSTVDILGENAQSLEAAHRARDAYISLARRLAPVDPRAELSIKVTQIGLSLSPQDAFESLLEIVEVAHSLGLLVCLDMEDSTTTDAILGFYRRLKLEHAGISAGLGVALQAYLHRSPKDVRSLLPLRPRVRLCKGIYVEPPSVALQEFQSVRSSYLALLEQLLAGGAFVAIATHDAWLLDGARALLTRLHVPPGTHEFQMLLGVGEPLRPTLRQFGSELRVYCPFGEDWHAYSLRRLRESPRLLRLLLGAALPAWLRR